MRKGNKSWNDLSSDQQAAWASKAREIEFHPQDVPREVREKSIMKDLKKKVNIINTTDVMINGQNVNYPIFFGSVHNFMFCRGQ